MKPTHYIVVYDNHDGFICPMYWSDESYGVLTAMSDGPVALFVNREYARIAIRISNAWALLLKAQGKPENTDFTTGRKNLRIVPCRL